MKRRLKTVLIIGVALALLLSACTIVIGYSRVLYDDNGSNSGSVPIDSSRYRYGDTVLVLGNTGNLTKNGSLFVGWNTEPDGSGRAFSPGDAFSIGSSSVVLYARWMPWTSIPGEWTLSYKWDTDPQWRSAIWTIYSNKTFTDNYGGAGVWDISGNMIQLLYNNGTSFYSDTLYTSSNNTWNSMQGTMSGPDIYGATHNGTWSAERGVKASRAPELPSGGLTPSGEPVK
jgi:hypothetical protein